MNYVNSKKLKRMDATIRMRLKMKASLSWIFFLLIFIAFINLVSATDFTPQGDINLRNIYSIENGLNATFQYYCNSTSCYSISSFLIDTDTDTTYNAGGVYILLNGSNYFILNETKLNETIRLVSNATTYTNLSELIDDLGDRGYTHLSNFSDDLGNRGYTSLSNFSNDLGFYNSSEINSSELEAQGDNKLGIIDSFINLLIDNRITQAFIKALGFYDNTEVYNKTEVYNISETYTKTEVDSNLSLYLLETDQRFNETSLALSINTTENIKALGFYEKSEVDSNFTLYLLLTDQRFNETDLINSINTTENIQALSFYTKSEVDSNFSKYLLLTDQRFNETDLINSVNQTTNIQSLGFYTKAEVDANFSNYILITDLPLANKTSPHCSNITGAASDLCTITPGSGADGNVSSICGDGEVLLGEDTTSCVSLNDTIDDRAGETYTNGSGISLVGTQINHSDTSSQDSSDDITNASTVITTYVGGEYSLPAGFGSATNVTYYNQTWVDDFYNHDRFFWGDSYFRYGTDPGTIVFWVNSSLSSDAGLFYADLNDMWSIDITDSNLSITVRNQSQDEYIYTTNISITNEGWKNIAVMFGTSDFYIAVDGEIVYYQDSDDFETGFGFYPRSNWAQGSEGDCFIFYDKIMNATEVSQIYNDSKGCSDVPTDSLLNKYNLDEGSGLIIYDSGPYSKDRTVNDVDWETDGLQLQVDSTDYGIFNSTFSLINGTFNYTGLNISYDSTPQNTFIQSLYLDTFGHLTSFITGEINVYELFGQYLYKTSDVIFNKLTVSTLNTGQGDNELYGMDQDVKTTSSVDFVNINATNLTISDEIKTLDLNVTNMSYLGPCSENWNGTCLNTYCNGNLIQSIGCV